MSIYDAVDNLDPKSNLKGLPLLPHGHYPKVMILHRETFKSKQNATEIYAKTRVRVVDPGKTGAEVGQEGEILIQIAGNKHDSYNVEGMQFDKKIVGCAFGYDGPTTRTKVTGKVIASTQTGKYRLDDGREVELDGKLLGGHCMQLHVQHVDRPGKKTIANFDCDRTEQSSKTGQPEVIPGFGPGSAPASAPASSPAAPTPPSAPAAPAAPPAVDHFARAQAAGFVLHSPGWFYRPGDANCTSEADLRAGKF